MNPIPNCQDCGKKLGDRRSIRCAACNITYLHKAGYLKAHILKLNSSSSKTNRIYGKNFTVKVKDIIRKHYRHQCQLCGKLERECTRKLHVHHIDYNKQNNNPYNLIPLCGHCHQLTNSTRTIWKDIFKYKVNRKICSMIYQRKLLT